MDELPNEQTALRDVAVLSHMLTPGSSLHPTFLLVVDGTFVFLLLILFLLAFVTHSVHFLALIGISLALWASVKWFVNELQQATFQSESKSSATKRNS